MVPVEPKPDGIAPEPSIIDPAALIRAVDAMDSMHLRLLRDLLAGSPNPRRNPDDYRDAAYDVLGIPRDDPTKLRDPTNPDPRNRR